MSKTVLILGANSDVAKAAIKKYVKKNYKVIAASRSTDSLTQFIQNEGLNHDLITVLYFDATHFESHHSFYAQISPKPEIVVYAAGFLADNEEALNDWDKTFQMIKVHYAGAVSIINIIVTDKENSSLERIIGLSSLSGVRGRKSNFIYGSTKSAFTQYLAGLRQYLSYRKVQVNAIIAGYIRSKMTAGLELKESLMLEPEYIADVIVNPPNRFIIVPGIKWKIIYNILKMLPESLVAKLP